MFQIDEDVSASFSELIIIGGNAVGDNGGGVWNAGDLTLTNCTISGSTADKGGGLWNTGTASLTNCAITGNHAVGGFVYDSVDPTLLVDITGLGGGFFNEGGSLTLTDSSISSNSADFAGGGVMNGVVPGSTTITAVLNMTNGSVNGNTAGKGAGLANSGTATLDNVAVTGNHAIGGVFSDSSTLTDVNGIGGGVANLEGTLTLTNSSVSGNTADFGGGGVVNGVPEGAGKGSSSSSSLIYMTNGYIDGNLAGKGAGLLNSGTVTLEGVMLTGNHAIGGVVLASSGAGKGSSGGGKGSTGPVITDINGLGGGVANLDGTLTLTNSTVSGNTADFGGGGVVNGYPQGAGKGSAPSDALLIMTGSSVTGNAAGIAGGVFNNAAGSAKGSAAGLNITDSTISDNKALPYGGTAGPAYAGAGFGVFNLGSAALNNVTISGNDGGGIFNGATPAVSSGGGKGSSGGGKGSTPPPAVLSMSNSTISANLATEDPGTAMSDIAGFGLVNMGSAALVSCTISGQDGGGVFNAGASAESTGGGKGSTGGGKGATAAAALSMTNCTVSGNHGTAGGVIGVVNEGNTILNHTTISDNDGGITTSGLGTGATTSLFNSIVAGNTFVDIAGSASGTNNLIGALGSGGLWDGMDGNIVGVATADLHLAPLGDYGGPTQTMALLPGSSAIDAGTATILTSLVEDVPDDLVTSITVADTLGIGVGLYIQIDSEIMLITGVTSDITLEVERGQLGTTATAHLGSVGAQITTLAADITDDVATSIEVADTTGLVVGDYIKIDDEILQIASVVSGSTLTVTRGQQGTAAAAHATATGVFLYTPAEDSVSLAADQTGIAYLSTPDIGAYEFTGDADVSVAVTPLVVPEDGGTNLVFTFTRVGDTGRPLTVNFDVGGTADFSLDYAQTGAEIFDGIAGTVTFAAGSSSATVTIIPTSDSEAESDETVVLTVSSGLRYNIGSPVAATGTIDEPPRLLSFTRLTPESSPTNADALVFQVTFNEDVFDVGFNDFLVTGTTATVTNVAPVSGRVYNLTVMGGDLADFNGTVGLDLSGTPTITDAAGNALQPGEPSIDETYLLDNEAPVLPSLLDLLLEATSAAGATATYSGTATDIVDGDIAVVFDIASGSTFALGTTLVTYSATDAAGNTSQNTFDVTVEDTTPPVLPTLPNISLIATSAAGATATYSGTATDIVDGEGVRQRSLFNNHIEGGLAGVAGRVGGRVGHRCRAHREGADLAWTSEPRSSPTISTLMEAPRRLVGSLPLLSTSSAMDS